MLNASVLLEQCAIVWQSLTTEQKAKWAADAARYSLLGYNQFLSRNIKRLVHKLPIITDPDKG